MQSTVLESQLSLIANDVMRHQLTQIRTFEPGARSGDSPEDLHDMRVATRRLRAALSTFAHVLPAEARVLERELRWLGSGLAAVRDLDVQLGRIGQVEAGESTDNRQALEQVCYTLTARRETARADLHRMLDSERYARLIALGGDMLTQPSPDEGLTLGLAAYPLVVRPFRHFRKRARHLSQDSPATEFHTVRKRARRLRYTVEFLTAAAPKAARSFTRRLVALQDVLGQHQDMEVAITELQAIAEREPLPPGVIFALGQLAQRHAAEAGDLRSQFGGVYRSVVGKPWGDLEERLRRAAVRSRAEVQPELGDATTDDIQAAPARADK